MIAVGGALAVLGSFLPWITATAAFVGTISRNGIDGGGDGLITVILGLAAAACGVSLLRGSAGVAPIGALICGIGMVAVVGLDLGSINERISGINGEVAIASVGTGIYVVGLGGALAVLGGLAAVSAARQVQIEEKGRISAGQSGTTLNPYRRAQQLSLPWRLLLGFLTLVAVVVVLLLIAQVAR